MEATTHRRLSGVFEREHDRLWRSLYAHIGDRELASDAEAEAWAQLVRRGEAVTDPAAWLWRSAFRIVGGLAADRRRTVVVSLHDEPADDDPAVVEMLSLLAPLSAQQRACVALRYVGGFTPTEIADLLDTTPGTVRVQLHRAHQALRDDLEEDDG